MNKKEIYFHCTNCGKCYLAKIILVNPDARDGSYKCECGGFIVTPNGNVSLSGLNVDIVPPKIKNTDIHYCKLIDIYREELGKPKKLNKGTMCEGYVNNDGEPHKECKACKSYTDWV